jgi:hypothetical protein
MDPVKTPVDRCSPPHENNRKRPMDVSWHKAWFHPLLPPPTRTTPHHACLPIAWWKVFGELGGSVGIQRHVRSPRSKSPTHSKINCPQHSPDASWNPVTVAVNNCATTLTIGRAMVPSKDHPSGLQETMMMTNS